MYSGCFENIAISMDPDQFTTIDDVQEVPLRTAKDIARFSFIVQDSLSYLHLELCENARFSEYFGPFCDCCESKRFTNFVNTEEKCRQFFAPRRRLLYSLNLDLPKERECCLKDDSPKYLCGFIPSWDCCTSPHITTIGVMDGWHIHLLLRFIEEALSIDIPNEKIMKWTITFSESPLLYNLKIRTASKFLDIFYPECTDSVLLRNFINQFDVVKWLKENEEPKILEYLLYHARLHGNMSLNSLTDFELINSCIFHQHYRNVGPILKYISGSELTKTRYENYLCKLSSERSSLLHHLMDEAEKTKARPRLSFMVQIYLVYIDAQSPHHAHGLQEAAPEALRLIWSSLPDACVTLGELRDVFEAALGEEEVTSMFDFYVKTIGEFHECVEPRQLQHLCGTILRTTFEANDLWIPDAISRTRLPKSLQSFLNLGMPFAV